MFLSDAIINSLSETIILFDRKKRVAYINKSGEEMIGKSSKDIIGKGVSIIFKKDNYISGLINKTLKEGQSFRGKSVYLNLKQTLNVDFSLSPFYNNDIVDGAVLLIARNIDIADREDYNFDSLVSVIGTIAHEIKNPLGGIKGAAQLMRNITHDLRFNEHIDLIIRETDRLNSILNDYLTICKNPTFNTVNIHEVIEKTISIMYVKINESGIELKKIYDPSLPTIKGDESKLLQVFLNIIKNAIESMERGGRLEIATYPSRESFREHGKTRRWVVVSVSDTGKGIGEEDIQKIFLPFHTNKKTGTGIGLAITKKIVRDHGGFITVKSIINKGTSFFIYIPF